MNITTNNTINRKELAQALAEQIGTEAKYNGPPTFAYQVGEITIARDGSFEFPEGLEDTVRSFLVERGVIEEETTTMNVMVPTTDMDGYALRNLINAMHSKQYLLNRVLGAEIFHIPQDLIDALAEQDSGKASEVLQTVEAHAEAIKGFGLRDEGAGFFFPLGDEALNEALLDLFSRTVAFAKAAKRVNPEEAKPENEKYYFRIWLVRLGLGGEGGKATRRALLDRLKGNSAFRTPEDAAKFAADQKAKREARKAAKLAANPDLEAELPEGATEALATDEQPAAETTEDAAEE